MSQDAIINNTRQGGSEADTLALISTYRRHLPVFLAVMAVVAALVTGFLATQPKAYTATTSVLMLSQNKVAVGSQDKQAAQQTDTGQSTNVDTQVEAIKSPTLAAMVVDKLNLVNDPEFNGDLNKPTKSTLAEQREGVIMHVAGRMKARRTGETYMASVSFTSRSPIKAAQIANAYADAFIEQQRQIKMLAVTSANGLLNSRLDALRQDVESADEAVQRYKVEHNLMSADGATLSEREIADTGLQLSLVRAQQAEAEARLNSALDQVKNGSNGEDVGDALGSVVIQNLRNQRTTVSQQLAQMQERLGPRHPDVLQAQRQLKDIDTQIQAEVARILSNLKAQAQVARERTASLAGSLENARQSLASSSEASVMLNELQRNADASKAVYEDYLAKYKETQQQSVIQPDAQVASVAQPPLRPSSPNKPLDLILGLLVGAGAGVLAVIARRSMESGLRTQDDIEGKLNMPYLGVPTAASAIKKLQTKSPVEAIVKHPLSGYAEAFRTLSTSFTTYHDPKLQTIAITSSLPNEGKTTTTIGTAQILAMGGAKVILLDCDLRRRNVNNTMGLNATKGLLDVLAGKMSVQEAVYVDQTTGVHYLVLPKTAVATTKSPLETPNFEALLAHLKTQYDYIVIDTPPLIPIVDTRVLAPKVDGVILLVRWQLTPRKAAEQSVKLLAAVGVRPLGVALTQVDLKAQQRYGYGDSSYYYKGYRDYYLEGESG